MSHSLFHLVPLAFPHSITISHFAQSLSHSQYNSFVSDSTMSQALQGTRGRYDKESIEGVELGLALTGQQSSFATELSLSEGRAVFCPLLTLSGVGSS